MLAHLPLTPLQPRVIGLPPSWARRRDAEERVAAIVQPMLVRARAAGVVAGGLLLVAANHTQLLRLRQFVLSAD